jgi:lysozyme family protein
MTALDYDESLRRVLADEGGYCDDEGDPGGPTKYGITIFDVRKYVKPNATAADVRALTVDQAKEIYRLRYWNEVQGDALPPAVDYAVFDYGVNSGVGRSGKVLRRLCGLPTEDWHVTPEVLAAVAKRDPRALSDAIWDERLAFLQRLSTWPRFGRGWGDRCRRGKRASQSMTAIKNATEMPPPPIGAPGKGHIPPPATKTIGQAGAATAVVSGGFMHWIGSHPFVSVTIFFFVVIAVVVIVEEFRLRHERAQMEPMPGTKPVPEKGT